MSTIVVTNIDDGTISVPATVLTEGGVKAWASCFYSGGTPTAGQSYNVTSLTDNGVGNTGFNLTNSFAATDFAVLNSNADTANRGLRAFSPGVTDEMRTITESSTDDDNSILGLGALA